MAAVAQRQTSDFGADTDCETQPPSDCDRSVLDHPSGIPTPAASVLQKMEELNKSNEQDTRSVASKKSSSSGSGGPRAPDSPSSSKSRQNSVQPDENDEDLDLWTVWGNLVKNWQIEYKKRPSYIKELVKRGIPCHFRTIAWQLLSGADASLIHDTYAEYMRTSSPHEKVIVRDISRTYPELEFFKDGGRGQSSLFNVIKAYSIHDPEVGYCQGSAFIVGQLLLQMPEEEAFAVFVKLLEDYRLRELYKPAMTELGLCMFQLECLVQEQMPDLFTHFNNMGFDTSMYASSWFLTLFTTTLPLDLANRIMDVFLAEGMEVIFRLAMAILQQARIDLLKLDMEGMLKYFQREVRERFENDHELLFTVAYNVTLNNKKMKRLEKDYMAKRTKEQEEAIELRRLRTENRLLRQRIEYLELESAALADRLIRGQVTLAQEAENCINISHEMHKLRDMNSDVHRRLEEAYDTIRELSCRRHEAADDKQVQVDDTTMIEHIHSLQQEMIETSAREADNENTIRDLKQRIQELEAANKRLKETPPDHCVATLQEELISVKMREAEASLSLKEMRQRLAELEGHWAKYIHVRCFENGSGASDRRSSVIGAPGPEVADKEKTGDAQQQQAVPQTARGRLAKLTASLMGTSVDAGDASSSTENNNGISAKELEDQLMGVRIREADTVAELKEMRQKVMELETQNHVCTNQLKRQDQELKRMREQCEGVLLKEKDSTNSLRDEQRKTMEALSQMKEQSVMARLKETEAMQTIADLKQKIAELELKKAEKWTHSQLRGGSVCDMDDDSLSIPGSRSQSIVSGDALSIGSESGDFNALIADMTVRLPDELRACRNDIAADTGDDTATETDDSPRSQRMRHSSGGDNPVAVVVDSVDSSADDSGVLLSPAGPSR